MSIKWKIFLIIQLMVFCTVWLAVHSIFSNNLEIVACDVGQGDGFLLTYKSTQVIIDGGPNKKIVNCVGKNIPFWDREIELVILTHPQKDHFLGLIEIFKNYNVDNFLANNLDNSTDEYRLLVSTVVGGKTVVLNPADISNLRVGLIYLDILSPKKEFLDKNSEEKKENYNEEQGELSRVLGKFTSKLDPNEFSIVTLARYGNFKALFTGDISPEKSDEVAQILKKSGVGQVNYIKVPHHGSRNGMSASLLETVNPEIAVISAGKNNSYGHPHEEILKMLGDKNVKILRTDQMGDVVVETDGNKLLTKK